MKTEKHTNGTMNNTTQNGKMNSGNLKHAKLETGKQKVETGMPKLETGHWKQKPQNWTLGNRNWEVRLEIRK